MVYRCQQFTTINQLKQVIITGLGNLSQPLIDGTIGEGITSLSASSSSKANTLNNCKDVKVTSDNN